MSVREMRECWNCGRSYNPDEHENCPSCGEYPENNPLLFKDNTSAAFDNQDNNGFEVEAVEEDDDEMDLVLDEDDDS